MRRLFLILAVFAVMLVGLGGICDSGSDDATFNDDGGDPSPPVVDDDLIDDDLIDDDIVDDDIVDDDTVDDDVVDDDVVDDDVVDDDVVDDDVVDDDVVDDDVVDDDVVDDDVVDDDVVDDDVVDDDTVDDDTTDDDTVDDDTVDDDTIDDDTVDDDTIDDDTTDDDTVDCIDCSNPYTLIVPDQLPITDTNTTCGACDNYDLTCLGSYDGGEDVIYELVVNSPIMLDIDLDPKGTTWTGIALDDTCPLDSGTCLYKSTNSSSGVHGLGCNLYSAGTYYIQVDTWPSPDCIPDFDLIITECGVDDDTIDDDTIDDDTVDDDTVDDDTIDDDTIDDDTIDDDTVDDDTIDDDTIDDDTIDDDTIDDDTIDDDTADDDTSAPGDPIIVINSPFQGQMLDSLIVDVDVDLYRVDSIEDITVLLDGYDITGLPTLTITPALITGEINATAGGEHTLRVEATNDFKGLGFDEVTFEIDYPWLNVEKPQAYDLMFRSTVEIEAYYGNCSDGDITVTLDGINITGSLWVYSGEITGEVESLTEDDHLLVFTAERGADIVEIEVPFTIELEDPHFEFNASATTIDTGEYVDLYYTFYDENGIDITSYVTIDITVDPNTGTVIDGDRVWFYYPGMFSVQVGTLYLGTYYTATIWVYVAQTEVYSLDITVVPTEIDAGDFVSVTAEVTDINGNPVYTTVVYTVDPPFGAVIDDYTITLTYAGEVTVRGNVLGTGIFDEETVTVNPADPYDVILYVDQPSVETGDTVHCAVECVDEYGNPTVEPTYIEVFPMTGVLINGFDVTFSDPGMYSIYGKVNNFPALQDVQVVEVVSNTLPGIVFISPPRGLYTDSSPIQVAGFIYDCDPYTSDLYINGGSVYVVPATGYFETTFTLVNGLNIIEAVVTDDYGNSAKGSTSVLYALSEWPNNSLITNAFGMRISDLGFNDIELVIYGYLIGFNIEPLVLSMNPIFDEKVEFWGMTVASAKAWVEGVDHSIPWVNFDCNTGSIATQAGIDSLTIWSKVRAYALGFIGGTYQVNFYMNGILMAATTWITADDHELVVDMSNMTFGIANFHWDVGGFPDLLEDLFEGVILWLIETLVPDLMESMLPPLIQEIVDQIPYDFDFALGEANYTFSAYPETIAIDGDGATINLTSRTQTDTINPIVPVFDGSLKTPSNMPEFLHYVPYSNDEIHFGFALGDDIINQMLYEVYRSGAVHMDFEEVFTACEPAINLVFPDICSTYGDLPLTMKIRPLLPPIIIFEPAKSSVMPAEIQMGDALVHLYVVDGGTESLVLTLATTIFMPVLITHDYQTNALSVVFQDVEVYVDTVSNPLGLNEALFEDLAPVLVELVLPLFEQLLQNFELPSLADGWILQLQQMFAIGGNFDYIGIYLELLPEDPPKW